MLTDTLVSKQESFGQFTSQFEAIVFGKARMVLREAPRVIDITDNDSTSAIIKSEETKALRFNIEKRIATAAMSPTPYWEHVSATEKALTAQEQFIHDKADRGEVSEIEYNRMRAWLMTRYSLWSDRLERDLKKKSSHDPISAFLTGRPSEQSERVHILQHSINSVSGGISSATRLAFRVISVAARKHFQETGAIPTEDFLRSVAENSFGLGIQISTMHSETQIAFENLLSKIPPQNSIELDKRLDAWDPDLFVLRGTKILFDFNKILEKARGTDSSFFSGLEFGSRSNAVTMGCPGMHVIKPVYDFTLMKIPKEHFMNTVPKLCLAT